MNSYELVADFSWYELFEDAGLAYDAGDNNSFFDAFDAILPNTNFVFKDSSALKDHLEDIFNLLYNRYNEWLCVRIIGVFDATIEAK